MLRRELCPQDATREAISQAKRSGRITTAEARRLTAQVDQACRATDRRLIARLQKIIRQLKRV